MQDLVLYNVHSLKVHNRMINIIRIQITAGNTTSSRVCDLPQGLLCERTAMEELLQLLQPRPHLLQLQVLQVPYRRNRVSQPIYTRVSHFRGF